MTSAWRLWFIVISAALGGTVFGAAPAGALSADAVALSLAQRFDVKILRVTPLERDGKSLFAVVVMNPGGNLNEALKVTTLIVDAETGDLVAQFRDADSGHDLPKATNRQPPADESGTAIRRETFRGR